MAQRLEPVANGAVLIALGLIFMINLLRADIVVINKVDTAPADGLAAVRESVRQLNPRAAVVEAASPITASE